MANNGMFTAVRSLGRMMGSLGRAASPVIEARTDDLAVLVRRAGPPRLDRVVALGELRAIQGIEVPDEVRWLD